MINFYEPKLELQFVSRETFIKSFKNKLVVDGTYVISINDTFAESDEITKMVLGHAPHVTLKTFVFPDEEIGIADDVAKSIIAVGEKAQDQGQPILVHCLMGVSRSGAVAKFLNEYLDVGNWFLESYHNHNKSIYNSLAAAAGTSLAAMYSEMEARERKDPEV